ncbi:magnesium transporter [Caulobacter ginsengisoli]|uniref:Magnesium transporter n=1 Tax=Caulobacter ginsengisoli TaxID=400775 RepID=A0ABU0IYM0_9CAUL|nr:magnesium transporter CorA family protein [Caulobacter ginsengisoli]MDQ0466273.1 magnesium transporter [Caulobacter ginsengisoli]
MLTLLRRGQARIEPVEVGPSWAMPADTVWLDLVNPTRDEELAIEAATSLLLPTQHDMQEIETSSRLYQDHGASFMTAVVLAHASDNPVLAPVTFVLFKGRLITIRYDRPGAFELFAAQLGREPEVCQDGTGVFLGLLDAIIDRVADILEETSAEVELVSQEIFRRPGKTEAFSALLTRLGRAQSVDGKTRASLISLTRILGYSGLVDAFEGDKEQRGRLRSLQRDVQSLADHGGRLSGDITFLLDAALGLINVEQNAIIKIFSVASVVFLPPTLVASIYGMNFKHMPELNWMGGYPFAIGLMLVSMLIPLWWFKRKGWL